MASKDVWQQQIIGVVRGYQNTPEFDRLMDDGYFTIVEANNDLQIARMLIEQTFEQCIATADNQR